MIRRALAGALLLDLPPESLCAWGHGSPQAGESHTPASVAPSPRLAHSILKAVSALPYSVEE